jgi:hypothetical protein
MHRLMTKRAVVAGLAFAAWYVTAGPRSLR